MGPRTYVGAVQGYFMKIKLHEPSTWTACTVLSLKENFFLERIPTSEI
jgi:hypothetical protein